MRFLKENTGGVTMKNILLLIALTILAGGGLFAQTQPQTKSQTDFPNGNYWSLNGGVGVGAILAHGELPAFQFIIEPKLWLSPALMVGVKAGVNYSTEETSNYSNILTFEGQVFLRWNFLRFGKNNLWNIFGQLGIGLISAYRGINNPADDVTETRGSVLADAALGITIPLTSRWHMEILGRGGYPHIWGAAITAGYKFPLPQSRTERSTRTEYVEIIKAMPPNEIIKIIKITAIEFVLFGPDIGRYNIGIDRDAQQLNELVLNYTSETLRNNPDFRVRVEGHANPFTINVSEAEDLMALSNMRANTVANLLREKGVKDEQIVIVGFGGTRTATSEWDIRNRNRRVELMIIQIDTNN